VEQALEVLHPAAPVHSKLVSRCAAEFARKFFTFHHDSIRHCPWHLGDHEERIKGNVEAVFHRYRTMKLPGVRTGVVVVFAFPILVVEKSSGSASFHSPLTVKGDGRSAPGLRSCFLQASHRPPSRQDAARWLSIVSISSGFLIPPASNRQPGLSHRGEQGVILPSRGISCSQKAEQVAVIRAVRGTVSTVGTSRNFL